MAAVDTVSSKPRVLSGLTCTSCAGTIDVEEGFTNVVCRYCGTPVAVVGERGVVRLMVLDRADRSAAGLALVVFGIEGMLIGNLALKLAAYLVSAVPIVGIAWLTMKKI